MAKNRETASTKSSTKSSNKSFKSLASKASATIKTIKQKATELLSPKKKKKHLCDNSDNSTIDTESQPPLEMSSQHSMGSIIEIPDDEDPDDELSE